MRFTSWSSCLLVLIVCHNAHITSAFTGFNLPLLQETLTIIGKDMLKGVTKMLNTNENFSFAADETSSPDATIDDETFDEDVDIEVGPDSEVKEGGGAQEVTVGEGEGEGERGDNVSPLVEDILSQDEEEVDYAKTLAQTAVNVAARKLMKRLGDEFKGVWE